jgi:serine/threonine protein kinase
MFTGKRPWHPLTEQNIMFKVHIEMKQQKPPYPTCTLSDEAVDFLDKCLAFDPAERDSADRLLDHPFVKVKVEENYFSII